MRTRSALTLFGSVVLFTALVPQAYATTAGANGAIIYTQYTSEPIPEEEGGGAEVSGNLRSIAPDGTGDREIVTSEEISESDASPSPDGRSLVYERGSALWISNIDGTGGRPLWDSPRRLYAESPSWSPDGARIVFNQMDGGIRSIAATGSPRRASSVVFPAPTFTVRSNVATFTPQYTPDGTRLLYSRVKFLLSPYTFDIVGASVWSSKPDGSDPRRVVRGAGDSQAILGFDLSPDGKQIVFVATGNWRKTPRRLFVARADGTGIRQLAVASAGHTTFGEPAWSPDGTKIVVGENQSSSKPGGTLLLLDAVTGARTELKTIPKGLIDEPAWQALPETPQG